MSWPSLIGHGVKRQAELGILARFAVVGLVGVAVNSIVLWLLTERGAFYYLVSSVVATEVAIVSNFFLNHAWTFVGLHDARPLYVRLLAFNVVSCGGLILTVATLLALRQLAGIHYLLANLMAIGVGAVWNYTASRRWTWRLAPVGRG